MGHDVDATVVAIAKQKQLGSRLQNVRALSHKLYGWVARYGYRPQLAIGWALFVAAVFALLFEIAAVNGIMAPTDRQILDEVNDLSCRPEFGGNWTTCSGLHARQYPLFNPIVYSFDLIVPVLTTQQTKDWAPLTSKPSSAGDNGVRREYWPLGIIFWALAGIESLIGWIVGIWLVAIASGLVRRD